MLSYNIDMVELVVYASGTTNFVMLRIYPTCSSSNVFSTSLIRLFAENIICKYWSWIFLMTTTFFQACICSKARFT